MEEVYEAFSTYIVEEALDVKEENVVTHYCYR